MHGREGEGETRREGFTGAEIVEVGEAVGHGGEVD